jgi:hypothetical protein
MPDLDLILQVKQDDADVRLPRQVNLSLLHNSGVPTAMKTASAPSIAGIRSVVKASRPAAVLAGTKPPRSGS